MRLSIRDAFHFQSFNPIGNLIEMLWKRYNGERKVLVLIDNYDVPFNILMMQPGADAGSLRGANDFFGALYQPLRQDERLLKVVMMENYRFGRTSFTPPVAARREMNFMNHQLAPRFGIYEEELDSLFDSLPEHLRHLRADRALVESRYCGYITQTTERTTRACSFSSMIAFFNSDGQPSNHWRTDMDSQVGNLLTGLMGLPAVSEVVMQLLEGRSYAVNFNGQLEVGG